MQKINNTTKLARVPLRLMEPGQRLVRQSPYDMTGTRLLTRLNVTEATTLGEFLHDILPEDVQKDGEEYKLTGHHKITIQGILPPLSTPMTWVVSRLSYLDGFLYVVLLPN